MDTTKGTFLSVSLPLYAWAVAILTVSSVPGQQMPEVSLWQWDKFAHVFEFAVLSVLLCRYLACRRGIPFFRAWPVSLAAGAGYGVLDELHQILIPMRSCAWQDMIADAAGVAIGVGVMSVYMRKRKKA